MWPAGRLCYPDPSSQFGESFSAWFISATHSYAEMQSTRFVLFSYIPVSSHTANSFKLFISTFTHHLAFPTATPALP